MASKLTENHPLRQKLDALERFMNETHIALDWDGYHLNVTDTQTNVTAVLKCSDDNSYEMTLPTFSENKLVIED
jgi:hypothetical protein